MRNTDYYCLYVRYLFSPYSLTGCKNDKGSFISVFFSVWVLIGSCVYGAFSAWNSWEVFQYGEIVSAPPLGPAWSIGLRIAFGALGALFGITSGCIAALYARRLPVHEAAEARTYIDYRTAGPEGSDASIYGVARLDESVLGMPAAAGMISIPRDNSTAVVHV
eukprot:TRINITY_DN2973_c0_g1_i1.p2 TRINITY_DN2973_c0_g1~~TRINITY_DN2973_c0_g1_i1.p2  ORF type:complete len:163 (+),score=23.76 TRINITY_DN2973_c0_g1_i1:579-1067(+)